MFNLEEQGGEAKAVGWISMTDMFMLCSIVMLVVAVCFAMSLKKSDTQLATVAGDYEKYRNSNTLTIEQMKDKAAQLTLEAGGYKTQALSLDEQLSRLKVQLSETETREAAFQNAGLKLKAESDGLTTELTARTLKLNTVQSEFEKYRSVNTAAMGELKTDLARLTKEADGYKSRAATLSMQLNTLENKLAESGKQSVALNQQKLNTDAELAKANGDLTRLAAELARVNGDFGKARGELTLATSEFKKVTDDLSKAKSELLNAAAEREQLLAMLNTSKSAHTALQKEDADLTLKLNTVREEKKRVEVQLADLEGTNVGLNGQIGELKPQIAKLKYDLTDASLRIVDLEKAVFEKINRAKLVVTVSAQDVPKGFTLELFVTDPLANECGPFSEVIFNEGDEIGVLQQSVDFKSGREGSQTAVFYSMRPIYSRLESSGTYSVKAMIRHNGNDATAQLPRPVMITCSVDLPGAPGPDAHQTAQLEITSPGLIKKVRRAGQLTSASPYKNMWPWQPVYHFERTLCDFRISGDRITNFRDFAKLVAEYPVTIQNTGPAVRGPEELKIDSIRNRSGN